MQWNAVIFGPADTPFEDGTFKLTISKLALQKNADIILCEMTHLSNLTFSPISAFTEEYPNKPPTVRFVSKMFHPNVYADGGKSFFILVLFSSQSMTFLFLKGICLDILQNRWSPTYDVSAILTSIQSLLDEPNPNSPANSVAAQLYQENRREYEKRVAAIVEQSWLNFPDDSGDEEGAKKAETSEEGAPSGGAGGAGTSTTAATATTTDR